MAETLVIRPYRPADWPAVWAIIEPIVRAGDTYPQSPDINEAEARSWWIDEHAAVFVAEDGDAILGTYYITDNKPGLGDHVANAGFMVAPWAGGRGIGRTMGEHSLKAAWELGYLALQFNLVLVTNTASIRIWDRLGFTRIGILPKAFRHPRQGFIDALVMYRWLGEED